jgi:hypothetical protein
VSTTACTLAAVAIWLPLAARAAHGGATAVVTPAGFELRAARATVSEALGALATGTGVAVRGAPARDGVLDLEVSVPSFDQMVRRLVGDQNFTVTYGKAGEPRVLTLLGAPSVPQPSPERFTTPAAAGDAAPMASLRALASEETARVGRRLGSALGTATPNLYQLARAAWMLPDVQAREAAVDTLARSIEERPLVAALAIAALGSFDDATLATGLRRIAGRRAARTADRLARRSQLPAFRARAAQIARTLRER